MGEASKPGLSDEKAARMLAALREGRTSVVVVVPTAMPSSIPAPVTRIPVVVIRSSIVAWPVIVVWIRQYSIAAAVIVRAPPAAAPCIADVTDFFRV
jgi:hypothetical protein